MTHVRTRHPGFSLVEALLAISIITVGLLPLLASLGVALRAKEIGLREARAARYGAAVASSLELAAPEIFERQRIGQMDLDEHLFWNPLSAAEEGLNLFNNNDLEEFRYRSRFQFVHQGYVDLRFLDTIEDVSPDNRFNRSLPGDNAADDGVPFFTMYDSKGEFDFRLATRVSRWRFARDSSNALLAYPAAYDYAVFVFDEGKIISADLEWDSNEDGATDDIEDDVRDLSTFALDRGTAVTLDALPNGTARVNFAKSNNRYLRFLDADESSADDFRPRNQPQDSYVLIEEASYTLSERRKIAEELGFANNDFGLPAVDLELARRSQTRPFSLARWRADGTITGITPSAGALVNDQDQQNGGIDPEAIAVPHNLLKLPVFCRAIVTGTVTP